ncbi:MAG: hypothetical protein NTW20_01530 [Rhodobacterales bacterium]|nr:hypothetical protein [Rhodobacterales bacterium]
MRVRLFALLVASVMAAPTLAGTWAAPEGCEAFLTVQSKSCRVSHYYRCEADSPGEQWRVDMDQEGPFFYSKIDSEGQWLESYDPIKQTLDSGPADPASMSDLVSEGMDTWSFGLSKADGTATRAEGYDRLTGKSVLIDGITLKQTEVDFTEFDQSGTVLRRSKGNEYINPEWRLFFAGPGETDLGDGQWLPIDGSPVDFVFPGEDGFLATQPIYDCDALTAKADLPQSLWRARYEP